MKISFASLFTKLTLATSVVGTLVGCDDPTYPDPKPITTASTAQARYQVVNAAPGAGDAQVVSIDNVALASPFTAVPYLGTSVYNNLPAGSRLLLFSTATNLNNQQVALRNAFNTNSSNTVFLTDIATRASTSTDQGGVRTVVLTDNLAAPMNAANAKVRFVNLSPSTPSNGSYGIYNSLIMTSLFPAVPTRAYRATSFTPTAVPGMPAPATTNFANFTEVTADTYTVDVRSNAATGTPLAGSQRVITLAAGKIYTLYVRGVAGSMTTPLGISVVTHN